MCASAVEDRRRKWLVTGGKIEGGRWTAGTYCRGRRKRTGRGPGSLESLHAYKRGKKKGKRIGQPARERDPLREREASFYNWRGTCPSCMEGREASSVGGNKRDSSVGICWRFDAVDVLGVF